MSRTVGVIGIGQSLRGDDAAGLEAVRRWRAAYPETAHRPDVQVELSELPGLGLLELLEGLRGAILVDAFQSGAAAGSVRELDTEQLRSFERGARSAHGWGVAETLAMQRRLNPAQPAKQLQVIGIEAGNFGLGSGLSPEVEAALPQACAVIQRRVLEMLEG